VLYFSKLRVISVLIFTLVISYFAASNFLKFDDDYFAKNIKLGLDLQGGSYLLLEIDNSPVIIQKLQNKLSSLKKFFKEKNIKSTNFKIIDDEKISFVVDETSSDEILTLLNSKESEINPYFQRFKTHEFDVEETKVWSSSNITLQFSDYGLVL
jgi:Preprotein translocase subunit SecD